MSVIMCEVMVSWRVDFCSLNLRKNLGSQIITSSFNDGMKIFAYIEIMLILALDVFKWVNMDCSNGHSKAGSFARK